MNLTGGAEQRQEEEENGEILREPSLCALCTSVCCV